ncbi:MAG: hypothetical protein AAF725_23425 [Acidobacteriota bacterium]
MPLVTIAYGSILIVIGALGYFGTGAQSATALIPAFIGVPVVIAGVLARNERFLKHAMHGAATLALLGTLGTLSSIPKLFTLLSGGEVARPAAVYSQSTFAVLSIIFLVLCVRSFIAARKAREAAAAG